MVERIQYTGTNYAEIKSIFGDNVLAPYFCMGFNMLSLWTSKGYITVNEGDYIVLGPDGDYHTE